MLSAAILDQEPNLAFLCSLRTECATFSTVVALCTMEAGGVPLHATITPIDVEGSLQKTDRDDIFAATGCSVATRDRGQGKEAHCGWPSERD